jgi:hypothetical protein
MTGDHHNARIDITRRPVNISIIAPDNPIPKKSDANPDPICSIVLQPSILAIVSPGHLIFVNAIPPLTNGLLPINEL